MDVLIKSVIGVLMTCVLCLVIAKQGKDISVLLSLTVCAMVIIASTVYLRPVMEFISRLMAMSTIDSELINILMKSVGIGILTEMAVLVCADAGHSSMGKALQIMATGAIIWVCLPLFNSLLDLLESILGTL